MPDRTSYRAIVSRFHSLIALSLMVSAFSIFADGFLSIDNFWTVMRQISVNTCLSVGMTLVILTGGIDLSVGSILALAGAPPGLTVGSFLVAYNVGHLLLRIFPPLIVAELGSGEGLLSELLARRCRKVIAFDIMEFEEFG